ncbi:MAG: hypothetical protein LJF06_13245 [Gemmatimonadetes bacterium]|nr:hypothetical protein [Gemmatimonadota bacterium]
MAKQPEDHPVSRRNFVLSAGKVGGALLVAGPALGQALAAAPLKDATRDLENGILYTSRGAGVGPLPEDLFSGLHWRLLGPFRSGRVDAVCGVVGRPNEFYFGSVNGGVWKSHDSGRVWEPVFDGQPVASIGSLCVAPSAPDTIYVGTGEATLRDSVGYGNGMYKSTDGGKTWTHIGLENTQHIGRVEVDPTNPDIVFVAAIGHFYGPHPDRGVFRTTDGGKTWRKVLYKNESVGAIDVCIDPTNPKVVFAGLWNTRRPPWFVYAPTNGPGGGLYKSTDGGDTWKELTRGLPSNGIGKSGIAVCPSEPSRVYAVIDDLELPPGAPKPSGPPAPYGEGATGQGGFFRSDDGGESWTRLSQDPLLWGRGWYFEHVVADPKNADIVYVSNVIVARSMDGGHTWEAIRGSPGGDDYHQAWISPDEPNTMIMSSDQGCIITQNARGKADEITWSSWLNQPIAQIYHVSVDPRFPYWVTGAQQDSGAVAVRSRGKFAEISMRDWEPVGAGGESGCTQGDPLHPGIIYGGTGSRYDMVHNHMIPGTTRPPAGPEQARSDWTQPLVLSPADPRALYYADQYVYKSTDMAQTWTRISDDLTRPKPVIPPNLDAAAANQTDRNGKLGVVYTIAPSSLLVPMLWIGTDDGLIKVTTNDGKQWTDVTPPALTPWSRITTIEASHFDFNCAYASVDRHQLTDFGPHIYRTRDMGKTWQEITTGLPENGYVHVVREDPERQGLLFAGTERGAFVSFDDGDHWQPLQLNLPVTSVRDFQIYDGDLIVATHGRGFWVIDDISALRQVDLPMAQTDAFLFKPKDTVLYDQGGDDGTPFQKDEPQAENPPEGAYIDYWLKSDDPGQVTLEILDDKGTVLETFPPQGGGGRGGRGGRGGGAGGLPRTSPLWVRTPEIFATSAGMHRVTWMPYTGGRRGFGFGGFGGRGGGPQRPVVTLPGTFTAKLTVNGKSYQQTFTVKPDPRF